MGGLSRPMTRHTSHRVIAFAVVAALVIFLQPSELPLPVWQAVAPSAGAPHPDALSPCSVSIVLYMDAELAEVTFVLNTLLGELRGACGGCLHVRTREQFVPDLRVGGLDCTAAILVARFGVFASEKAALEAHASVGRSRVILFHTSDEYGDKDVSSYPLFRLVMRNYDDVGERSADVAYLTERGDEALPLRTLWVPLGHTNNAIRLPILKVPTSARSFAWSWTGDTKNKPQRKAFLEGVSHSTMSPDVQHRGRIHEYWSFMGTEDAVHSMLSPLAYAEWLHSSRVIPCPNGGSAEQFRIWEALFAGAVPIVSAGQRHLRYLDTLGFHVLRVGPTRWGEDAVPLLYAADTNATFIDELGAMQVHNERTLVKVMSRLSHRVASEVCAAAGARCTSPGVCVPTAEPRVRDAVCRPPAFYFDWAAHAALERDRDRW